MFRNKRNSRAAAHMANAAPSSAAASTAAVQAFLASQASSSKLSSAAAAAALRSHTASPTNPASIQTKRMQRRLSVSSNGSAASQPTLQRRGSGGSMTERTFREPSPSRAVSPFADHPPLPPIPKNLPKNRPPPSNGRPMSAEPPRARPPMSKPPHTRVASLDRGNVKPKNESIPPMPKPKPTKIDTNVKEPTTKRPLINFSRPMSPTLSPPASPAIATNGNIKKPEPKTVPNGNTNANKKPTQSTAKAAEKSETTDTPSKGAQVAAGRAAATASKAIADLDAAKEEESQSDKGKSVKAAKTPLPQQSTTTKKDEKNVAAAVRPAEQPTKQSSVSQESAKGETPAKQLPVKTTTKINETTPAKSSPASNGKALTPSETKPVASQALTTPDAADPTRRRSSLSPGRIARFSSHIVSDMSSGIKHEPLRAASPAKSALKQSPTPRGPSPALIGAEVSDNMSVASSEGTKKRASMRVSFENGPTVVGSAAEASPNRSPFIFSPQDKDPASRPHFDFGKKLDDFEADEVIAPVPTLPSFGSIRGRSERHSEDPSVLYGDEQARKNLAEMTSSNDHAIGAIINQDVSARRSNDPVPPQVTSVEGSGEHSDVDSSDEDDKPTAATDELVPTIALVPATPGLDTENPDTWFADNASGTKVETSPETAKGQDNTSTVQPQRQRSNSAPERDSIVEPEPESAQREHDPHTPVIGTIAESLQKRDDEDDGSDTGDSVYSDAAEDPAELEGDGFGSINAIVDSPVASPVVPTFNIGNKGLTRAQDESPSPAERHPPAPDWEPTKAYWSGINENKKTESENREIEDASDSVGIAVTSTTPERQTADSARLEKPTIPEKSSARAQTPVTEPAVIAKTATAQDQPKLNPAPKKPAMKSSLRQSSPPAVSNSNTPTMRKSMRGPPPETSAAARRPVKARQRTDSDMSQASSILIKAPISTTTLTAANLKKLPQKSTQPLPVNGTANGNAKRMSTMSTKSAPLSQVPRAAPPKLSRTFSNDSDSSSSFKRERARKPRAENSYAMRRSMRAAPVPAQAKRLPSPDSGVSMRSRPVSMSGVSLRTSMRDTPAVPVRPSSVRVASPNGSFFGRMKNSKPPMSRNFSDSSGGEVPTTFRSRFANSSDEEDDEPQRFTPVRGIPRQIIEEDSTDLDDSDEESRPQPKSTSTSVPASKPLGLASKSMRPTSPETPVVTNLSSLIPTDKKRKSIFGVLGRRKDKSKIGKSELDSAARRDTPLERTKFERKETDRTVTPEPPTPLDTPLESPAGSPSPAIRPGKLQRRGMSSRTTSDSFFHPPPIPADIPPVPRPITSDGSPQRPALGSRNVSNTTTNTDGVALGRTGKKKRFPMLRKAFGLHD